MERMTFYLNGNKVCWVLVDPSQKQIFESLMAQASRYLDNHDFNLQFSTISEGSLDGND